MADLTYDEYLGLAKCLKAVQPVTPERHRRVFAAEHFFIIAHQTTELWVKQVLMDIDHATVAAAGPDRDPDLAAEHVGRAGKIISLLVEHVGVLRCLQPRDFAQFRPALGTSSGAQSAQLHRLRRVLGLASRTSPLLTELLEAAAEQNMSLTTIYRHAPHAGPLYRLAEAMADLSHAFWQWQLVHVEVTTRAIGSARGTGRTSGAQFLARRLAVPFPELWEARTLLHAEPGNAADDSAPAHHSTCPWQSEYPASED